MRLTTGFAVASIALQWAAAEQTEWGQCGGIGFTGPTACIKEWHCQYWNDWYSQCVPGAPSSSLSSSPTSSSKVATSTTRSVTSTTVSKGTTLTTSRSTTSSSTSVVSSSATSQSTGGPTSTTSNSCTETWSPISASAFVAALSPGWNSGNTLDAIPDEGSWNNPPLAKSTLDYIKAAGFKSIRIPVTYADHFTGTSPDWTIDPAWLQRVSDVIDMATAEGLYVLTNIQHDSWRWADVTQPDANLTMIFEKFHAVWVQIGRKLACKPSTVAFEPINEPPATTAADGVNVNRFNTVFLQALQESGGFSAQRVVTLVGGGEDGAKTTQWFTRPPENTTNPWAIQYHYYSPYDFTFGAWGKTIWGSDADKQAVSTDLGIVRGNFTDVPILMGEFDATTTFCEAAGRRKWFDYVVRTARSLNTSVMMWDNGLDQLDRSTGVWRDPDVPSIITNALAGVPNSLADSTTDPSALTQWTSAYIFHKVGDSITDQTLPFLFNGNTLTSITVNGGEALKAPTDYNVSGENITFTSAFLSTYFLPITGPGSLANLTLTFSTGSPANVEIVQWDVPTLASNTSVATAGSDLSIPIVWKGLHMVAAVKIVESDGTYLVDDWTQWLPPLQQGRGTYSNQYSIDNAHVIIASAAVSAVIAANKSTTFTFEFYPRLPSNSVNYTLTV